MPIILYGTDWVGHEVGPSDPKYKDALRKVFEIIVDQICFAKEKSEHGNLIGLITTDHGSRDVDNLMKVEVIENAQLEYHEFGPGSNNIGHDRTSFQSISRSSPDVLYWYYVGSGDAVNRHGYATDDHDRFNIGGRVLGESFQSHNKPDIIEIADRNKYFYPQIYGDVWKGSHGASIRNRQQPQDLNPDDFTIPYIFFRFTNLQPRENLLNDIRPQLPEYHHELRTLFLLLLRKYCTGENRALIPSDPKNRGETMPNLPRMLSLHSVSQQCQLLEKAYNTVAKELPLDSDLLDHFRGYIYSESESAELSMASKLLLMYVRTGSVYPKYGGIRQIIKCPSNFEGKLSTEELTMMKSLERFSNINQILSEIKNLSNGLIASQSVSDAAKALEETAQRLKTKAIEIEKLLA